MTYWCLSFADPERPRGNRFLGCVVVAAGSLRDAIETAWRKRINPGGEAIGFQVPAQYEHVIAERNWADRLLSKAELNAFGEFSDYDRARQQ